MFVNVAMTFPNPILFGPNYLPLTLEIRSFFSEHPTKAVYYDYLLDLFNQNKLLFKIKCAFTKNELLYQI